MLDVNIIEKIKNNNWRQGSIFSYNCHLESVKELPQEASWLFAVITHDCDIVSYQEPYLEILGLTPLEKLSGDYTHGKSFRRMHLPIETSKNLFFYECKIINRYFINKDIFVNFEPSYEYKLSDLIKQQLLRCVANRYTRSAFPDEFDNRLKKQAKKIKEALAQHAVDLVSIYIKLNNWGELPLTEAYKIISLYMTLTSEQYQDEQCKKTVDAALEKFVDALSKCDGIIVGEDYRVVSEDDFSLTDVRKFKEWKKYEHLSFKGETMGVLSPAI